jgi:hypothetical protein
VKEKTGLLLEGDVLEVSNSLICNPLAVVYKGVCGKYQCNEIAAPTKQGSPHHRQFSKAHTGSRVAHGFQTSGRDYITKLCRQQAEVIQNHENENVRNIAQGEVRHRINKRLKLSGGQAYDRSSDYIAVATKGTRNGA